MKNIICVLLLIVSVSCGKSNSSGNGPNRTVDPVESDPSRNESQAISDLLWLINSHRARTGLQPVQRIPMMDFEAKSHSNDMADGRVPFGHFGMNARCQQARQASGGGNACGEIVARGQNNSQAAMNSWLSSLGHRRKIEDPRYNRVGLGVSVSRSNTPYWTVIFLQR
jgi:uncharacterized protein YkwD